MELVERGAASKREAIGDRLPGEEFHECARDHEILLDLPVEHPRRALAPLGDEVFRNHSSGSTLAFTASFQRLSRGAPLRLLARTSGATS